MLQKWWCPSTNHNLKFLTHWKCVGMLHRALSLHGLCAFLHCTLLSSKTWVSGHFMIISYFLRSLHLPPYFLENIYVLWQTNTFLRTYKYEILFIPPAIPAIPPNRHATVDDPRVTLSLLLSITHRCWDNLSISWALSLETSFKSCLMASWILVLNAFLFFPQALKKAWCINFNLYLTMPHTFSALLLPDSHDLLLPFCSPQLSAW